MAAKILHVWNDRGAAIRRIAAGRTLISSYTWELEKSKLTAFYADLLSGSPTGTLAPESG
jgi:hypothetical protein